MEGRPTDARRDASVERLKDAYVRGDMSLEDMESRVGWVLTAPTQVELRLLTSDVPGETAVLPRTAAPILDSSAFAAPPVPRRRTLGRELRLGLAGLAVGLLVGTSVTAVVTHQPHNPSSTCLVLGKHGHLHRVC